MIRLTTPATLADFGMIPIIAYEDRHEMLAAVFNRTATFDDAVTESVETILAAVADRGDDAVLSYTEEFDGVRPDPLRVSVADMRAAKSALPEDLAKVIEEAAANIRRFHERQKPQSWFTEEPDGVILGQRMMPMERVGLYVPGGTAFYPSSLLMNVIPAQVAGVGEIAVASPPGDDGLPNSLVLGTAQMLGLEEIYAVGGAQAVGAMAFGTESIARVDMVAGPGNAYVASAKKQVFGRVAIDSVAGPSEIVVLADDTANPRYVAADLLSQAEHDPRASAILATPSQKLAANVQEVVADMVEELPRREIVCQSLNNYGACIVTASMEEAVSLVNELAPEHLEYHVRDPWSAMTSVYHAGAHFLGPYSSEPVGDYFAGPNHVLPTGGTARHASALGVHDFVRRQSVISYSRSRLQKDGAKIARFARAEDLEAHARAVEERLR